jgi:hypothetical protein
MSFLFCADPLKPRRVDEHFASRAQAVRDADVPLALIDHDALTAGRAAEAVRRVPEGFGPAWYLGWMVRSEQYGELHDALAARGCRLMTDPEQYRTAHELPGWLDAFAGITPDTVILRADEPDLAQVGWDSFVVKDHVKSRKHEWHEACYAPDPAALPAVAARFFELQGDDLVGGLVVRRFEELEEPQVRVWWVDGDAVFVGPHPDTPDAEVPAPDLGPVRAAVRRGRWRFVTTDLARRRDGEWRVIEMGDGQVSDWPSGADPDILISALPT